MAKTRVPSDPYISEVSLTNFKSVVEQKVDLGRLTLLVGENSAGKSSILQVLRLLRQRLQSEGDIVPLNSYSLRLGTIDDIRTQKDKDSKDSVVSFGIKITDPDNETIKTIDWGIKIHDTVDGEKGSTYLKGLWVKCYNSEDELQLNVDLNRDEKVNITKESANYCYDEIDMSFRSMHEEMDIISLTGSIANESSKKEDQVSGWVSRSRSHYSRDLLYLPWSVTIKRHANQVLTEAWLHHVIKYSERLRRRQQGRAKEGYKSDETSNNVINKVDLVGFAVDHIKKLLGEKEGKDVNILPKDLLKMPKIPVLGKDFLQDINSNKDNIRGIIIDEITEKLMISHQEIDIVYNIFEYEYEEVEYETRGSRRRNIGAVIERTMSRMQYLGPLREEPHFFTLTDFYHSSTDRIGIKGELMAAVLAYHQGEGIKLKLPVPDNPNEEEVRFNEEEVRLKEAITKWAKYIKLVEDVGTHDRADQGRGLEVKPGGGGVNPEKSKSMPLMSVGVGVSQLLPVLMVCLLAKPGDVILLEQPELHIHPALQQRLADFFIAISRSGRQLIVETHSEYIITRLRLRIAEEREDADDKLTELVKVIFAKRENGATKYSPLKLTSLGDIEEWPEGFFDQAAEDEQKIMIRALEKQNERKSSDLPEGG